MANDIPGLRIAEYLNQYGDKIIRLYLHEGDNLKYGNEIIQKSGCEKIYKSSILNLPDHIKELEKERADFIITVYWAHLLSPEIYNSAKSTVNFHPSLLPFNRGWYPHVHSLIDGSPLGVTLHKIEKGPDTGPIWAQKITKISEFDTAKTLYDRQQSQIVDLFIDNWEKIRNNKIKPVAQDHSKATFKSKHSLKDLDSINIEKKYVARDLINLLRARSFNNLGFAYYKSNGEKIYLNLRLSKNNKFELDLKEEG